MVLLKWPQRQDIDDHYYTAVTPIEAIIML